MERQPSPAGEVDPDQTSIDLLSDDQATDWQRIAAAKSLTDHLERLDEPVRQIVIATRALQPDSFIADPRLVPNAESPLEEDEFFHQTLVGVIDQLEPETIERLAGSSWYAGSDEIRQQFDQLIIPRLKKLRSTYDLSSELLERLDSSQQLELLSGIIENWTKSSGEIYPLSCIGRILGPDEAERLLLEQAQSRPKLAANLLCIQKFDETKTAALVDTAVEAGQVEPIINDIYWLKDRLSPEQMDRVIDIAIQTGQVNRMLGSPNYLEQQIAPEQMDRVAWAALVEKGGDLHYVLRSRYPRERLCQLVDVAIEAGHIDPVLNHCNLAGSLGPERMGRIVEAAVEAGKVGAVLQEFKHFECCLSPKRMSRIVEAAVEADQVELALTRLIRPTSDDGFPHEQARRIVDVALEAGYVEKVLNNSRHLADHLSPERMSQIVDVAVEAGKMGEVMKKIEHFKGCLSSERMGQLVDVAVEAGKAGTVLGKLKHLKSCLSPERMGRIVDAAVETGRVKSVLMRLGHLEDCLSPNRMKEVVDAALRAGHVKSMLDNFGRLREHLSPEQLNQLLDGAAKSSPGRVVGLYYWGSCPPPTGEAVTRLADCMVRDDLADLAPAYFRDAAHRLVRDEGKPSFGIVFNQTRDVYGQIYKVLSRRGGRGMLERIQATTTGGVRANLEGISLAVAVVNYEEIDWRLRLSEIETADDARACLVGILNRQLDLELDTSQATYDQLTDKMGSLLPTLAYANNANQAVRNHLSDIVNALAEGSYQQYKYPELEPLVEAGNLPAIDQVTYQHWQTDETSGSANIIANNARAVADKIRQALEPALSKHPALAEFAHLPDSGAKLVAISASLARLGQQIAAANRKKQSGEISPEQAAAATADLQQQKQQLELARDAIRLAKITVEGVVSNKIHNEDGRPTQAPVDQTLAQLASIANPEQSHEAIDQLCGLIDNYRTKAETSISQISVSDVDDFQTTIEIGANPVGSCQHYQTGSVNEGLLGYFDPGVKLITVRNPGGGLIARAVLRLAHGPDQSGAMVLEPIYVHQASNDIEQSVKDHARAKAEAMGLNLYGLGQTEPTATITLPAPRAPYFYSDLCEGLHRRGEPLATSQLARLN